MLQRPELERLLVVMAHPDDVDFGSAGTIATLTAQGVEVTYCLVTDGEAGGSDRTMSRAEMASLRRKEQTEAAHIVGVHDLVFLGHPDGAVEATLGLRREPPPAMLAAMRRLIEAAVDVELARWDALLGPVTS